MTALRTSAPVDWYRERLLALHERGVTWAYMKRTTGLSYATLRGIRLGTQERIHAKTAAKLSRLMESG